MQTKIPDSDPATWSISNAIVLGCSLDFGSKRDHSVIIRGGAYAIPGQEPVIAIQSIEQLPLQTPVSEVLQQLVEARASWRAARAPTITMIDSTSNISFFEQACNVGIEPTPIGLVSTGSLRHATLPKHTPVGERKYAREFHVSRTLMLDELGAAMAAHKLVITGTGHADMLRAELSTLQRTVSEARNIVYKTPEGTHDDLVIGTAMLYYGLQQALRLKSRFTGVRPPRVEGDQAAINAGGWT